MSKTKRPKKTKVGDREYDIVWYKTVYDDNGMTVNGTCDSDNMEILISTANHSYRMKTTLLHEIVHGLDDFSAINLTEKQVAALSHVLFMWINDNMHIVKYLTENNEKPKAADRRESDELYL